MDPLNVTIAFMCPVVVVLLGCVQIFRKELVYGLWVICGGLGLIDCAFAAFQTH